MTTRKEMLDVAEEVFGELRDLMQAGQAEYARTHAFGNFERVGESLDVSREKVLMVYMLKHLDGIMSHLDGHTSQREDVRGRINDAINYLILLRGMLDERPEASREVVPGIPAVAFVKPGVPTKREIADFT